jgi:hypothetical protein
LTRIVASVLLALYLFTREVERCEQCQKQPRNTQKPSLILAFNLKSKTFR